MDYGSTYRVAIQEAKDKAGSLGARAVLAALEAKIELLKEQSVTQDTDKKNAMHGAILEIRDVIKSITSKPRKKPLDGGYTD